MKIKWKGQYYHGAPPPVSNLYGLYGFNENGAPEMPSGERPADAPEMMSGGQRPDNAPEKPDAAPEKPTGEKPADAPEEPEDLTGERPADAPEIPNGEGTNDAN